VGQNKAGQGEQLYDRDCKFLTEMMMDAENFNSAIKFSKKSFFFIK